MNTMFLWPFVHVPITCAVARIQMSHVMTAYHHHIISHKSGALFQHSRSCVSLSEASLITIQLAHAFLTAGSLGSPHLSSALASLTGDFLDETYYYLRKLPLDIQDHTWLLQLLCHSKSLCAHHVEHLVLLSTPSLYGERLLSVFILIMA